jgi:hypothetical protein
LCQIKEKANKRILLFFLDFSFTMFGNIVPLTTVGAAQVLPGTVLQTTGNVLPTNTMGNNDLVIIQDTTTATSQAELINQLQNHITENQQILIITDDQGQDQCKRIVSE